MQPKSLYATSAGPIARFKWVLHVLRPVTPALCTWHSGTDFS